MALGYQPSLSSQVGLVTIDIVDILCHYRDALISGPLRRGSRGLGGKAARSRSHRRRGRYRLTNWIYLSGLLALLASSNSTPALSAASCIPNCINRKNQSPWKAILTILGFLVSGASYAPPHPATRAANASINLCSSHFFALIFNSPAYQLFSVANETTQLAIPQTASARGPIDARLPPCRF